MTALENLAGCAVDSTTCTTDGGLYELRFCKLIESAAKQPLAKGEKPGQTNTDSLHAENFLNCCIFLPSLGLFLQSLRLCRAPFMLL